MQARGSDRVGGEERDRLRGGGGRVQDWAASGTAFPIQSVRASARGVSLHQSCCAAH